MTTRVHVTGGSGFLGGFVIPLLCKSGYSVTALARSAAASSRVEALGAEPIRGDLDDLDGANVAFARSRAEHLVNLASLGFGHAHPILEAAEAAGIMRAVFVSTTGIFTTLRVDSREARTSAEELIRGSRLDWTIVRPTMIYGAPGDRNMERLIRYLRRYPVLPLPGGGKRLQQPVHVEDVAQAIVGALMTSKAVGKAYNLAGPEPLPMREVIVQVAAAVNRHPLLVPVPLEIALKVTRAYERRVASPRIKAEQIMRLAEDKAFDIEAARVDLGYAPRTFAAGIAQECRSVR